MFSEGDGDWTAWTRLGTVQLSVADSKRAQLKTPDCYRYVWPVPSEKHTESWSQTITSSLYRAGVSG